MSKKTPEELIEEYTVDWHVFGVKEAEVHLRPLSYALYTEPIFWLRHCQLYAVESIKPKLSSLAAQYTIDQSNHLFLSPIETLLLAMEEI